MQCAELFGNPDLLTIAGKDKPEREGASISRIEIAFSSAGTTVSPTPFDRPLPFLRSIQFSRHS